MATNTLQIALPGFDDPFADLKQDGRMSSEFYNWLSIVLVPAVQQTATVFGASTPVSLTAQNAAIGTTSIPVAALSTGLYRVSIYTRITSPDGAGSSVQPSIGFVDNGVTCTLAGVAMTSDAINLPSSNVFFVSVDSPGPITYSVAYSSTTPNKAQYSLQISVERVQ